MIEDVALAVFAPLATFGGLYLLARAVGLGKCWDCGRSTVPWSVYCRRHRA